MGVVVDVGVKPSEAAKDKEPDAKGLPVTFSDLTYTVNLKKGQTLDILAGLSGNFSAGRLTALMGPSGSGKTTLMDVLAGRKSGAGTIKGEILYGGAKAPTSILKHLCGYVEQFDTLVGELTVEQMLMYTAEMKLPLAMTRDQKMARVKEVISMLKLEKCKDTVIGNALQRGISGGQAKRVNVALSLITLPQVVFLDEPTSGLDSKMANEVCAILKDLVKGGCTIVATIHSPTSFAFSMFDDLMMLAAGGAMVYAGEVSKVRAHFEALSFPFPQEIGYSLPDWLVEVTSGTQSQELEDEKAFGEAQPPDFASLWTASESSSIYMAEHSKKVSQLKASPADLHQLPDAGPGQMKALQTLLAYRMTTHYKDGEFLGPRIGDKVFMGLLAMSLYWDIGASDEVQALASTAGALFFFCALCGYGAAAFVPSLTLERALFYRERADGLYWAVTYYAAKFIEESVLCAITSLLFSVIVFFAMSLQGSFIIFVLTYYLTAMTGIVLAYLVAAIAPNMEAANALLPTYVTTCLYFGGLLIVFDKIPDGWAWYSWTSFLRYAWGSMMLNQFKDTATGEAKVFYKDGVAIDILEFYGLDDGLMSDGSFCMAILGGLCMFFGILGALAVTFISHVKR